LFPIGRIGYGSLTRRVNSAPNRKDIILTKLNIMRSWRLEVTPAKQTEHGWYALLLPEGRSGGATLVLSWENPDTGEEDCVFPTLQSVFSGFRHLIDCEGVRAASQVVVYDRKTRTDKVIWEYPPRGTLTESEVIRPYGLKIIHEGRAVFHRAIRTSMGRFPTTVAYKEFQGSLYLTRWYGENDSDQVLPPHLIGIEQIIGFTWDWLNAADYGDTPAVGDGEYRKGFRICSGCYWEEGGDDLSREECEEKEFDEDIFVVITPEWLYFGTYQEGGRLCRF
jgi:hypothetical protein